MARSRRRRRNPISRAARRVRRRAAVAVATVARRRRRRAVPGNFGGGVIVKRRASSRRRRRGGPGVSARGFVASGLLAKAVTARPMETIGGGAAGMFFSNQVVPAVLFSEKLGPSVVKYIDSDFKMALAKGIIDGAAVYAVGKFARPYAAGFAAGAFGEILGGMASNWFSTWRAKQAATAAAPAPAASVKGFSGDGDNGGTDDRGMGGTVYGDN